MSAVEASEVSRLREALIRAIMEARECSERTACEYLADYFALLAS